MAFGCNEFCKPLIFAAIILLLAACHKDKQNDTIKDVTGYTWKLSVVWQTGDYYIQPDTGSPRLKLNSDRSFTFILDGASCSGSYSWNMIDSTSASVSFVIKKWSNPPQNSTANKLNNVLGGINKCYYLKGYNIPVVISAFTNPELVLDFEGTKGYFYVYR